MRVSEGRGSFQPILHEKLFDAPADDDPCRPHQLPRVRTRGMAIDREICGYGRKSLATRSAGSLELGSNMEPSAWWCAMRNYGDERWLYQHYFPGRTRGAGGRSGVVSICGILETSYAPGANPGNTHKPPPYPLLSYIPTVTAPLLRSVRVIPDTFRFEPEQRGSTT